MIMFFSNEGEKVEFSQDFYQTDNIYQFLKMAKEVRPQIVVMKFGENFNTDEQIVWKIKEILCEDGVCPRIYMNVSEEICEERFFENVYFEKEDIKKYLN